MEKDSKALALVDHASPFRRLVMLGAMRTVEDELIDLCDTVSDVARSKDVEPTCEAVVEEIKNGRQK